MHHFKFGCIFYGLFHSMSEINNSLNSPIVCVKLPSGTSFGKDSTKKYLVLEVVSSSKFGLKKSPIALQCCIHTIYCRFLFIYLFIYFNFLGVEEGGL